MKHYVFKIVTICLFAFFYSAGMFVQAASLTVSAPSTKSGVSKLYNGSLYGLGDIGIQYAVQLQADNKIENVKSVKYKLNNGSEVEVTDYQKTSSSVTANIPVTVKAGETINSISVTIEYEGSTTTQKTDPETGKTESVTTTTTDTVTSSNSTKVIAYQPLSYANVIEPADYKHILVNTLTVWNVETPTGGTDRWKYEWKTNDSRTGNTQSFNYTPTIAGAKTVSLTVSALSPDGTTTWGDPKNYGPFSLQAYAVPEVPTPKKVTTYPGLQASLHLEISNNGAKYAYQWRDGNAEISGETTDTYTFTAVNETEYMQSKTYTVHVVNYVDDMEKPLWSDDVDFTANIYPRASAAAALTTPVNTNIVTCHNRNEGVRMSVTSKGGYPDGWTYEWTLNGSRQSNTGTDYTPAANLLTNLTDEIKTIKCSVVAINKYGTKEWYKSEPIEWTIEIYPNPSIEPTSVPFPYANSYEGRDLPFNVSYKGGDINGWTCKWSVKESTGSALQLPEFDNKWSITSKMPECKNPGSFTAYTYTCEISNTHDGKIWFGPSTKQFYVYVYESPSATFERVMELPVSYNDDGNELKNEKIYHDSGSLTDETPTGTMSSLECIDGDILKFTPTPHGGGPVARWTYYYKEGNGDWVVYTSGSPIMLSNDGKDYADKTYTFRAMNNLDPNKQDELNQTFEATTVSKIRVYKKPTISVPSGSVETIGGDEGKLEAPHDGGKDGAWSYKWEWVNAPVGESQTTFTSDGALTDPRFSSKGEYNFNLTAFNTIQGYKRCMINQPLNFNVWDAPSVESIVVKNVTARNQNNQPISEYAQQQGGANEKGKYDFACFDGDNITIDVTVKGGYELSASGKDPWRYTLNRISNDTQNMTNNGESSFQLSTSFGADAMLDKGTRYELVITNNYTGSGTTPFPSNEWVRYVYPITIKAHKKPVLDKKDIPVDYCEGNQTFDVICNYGNPDGWKYWWTDENGNMISESRDFTTDLKYAGTPHIPTTVDDVEDHTYTFHATNSVGDNYSYNDANPIAYSVNVWPRPEVKNISINVSGKNIPLPTPHSGNNEINLYSEDAIDIVANVDGGYVADGAWTYSIENITDKKILVDNEGFDNLTKDMSKLLQPATVASGCVKKTYKLTLSNKPADGTDREWLEDNVYNLNVNVWAWPNLEKDNDNTYHDYIESENLNLLAYNIDGYDKGWEFWWTDVNGNTVKTQNTADGKPWTGWTDPVSGLGMSDNETRTYTLHAKNSIKDDYVGVEELTTTYTIKKWPTPSVGNIKLSLVNTDVVDNEIIFGNASAGVNKEIEFYSGDVLRIEGTSNGGYDNAWKYILNNSPRSFSGYTFNDTNIQPTVYSGHEDQTYTLNILNGPNDGSNRVWINEPYTVSATVWARPSLDYNQPSYADYGNGQTITLYAKPNDTYSDGWTYKWTDEYGNTVNMDNQYNAIASNAASDGGAAKHLYTLTATNTLQNGNVGFTEVHPFDEIRIWPSPYCSAEITFVDISGNNTTGLNKEYNKIRGGNILGLDVPAATGGYRPSYSSAVNPGYDWQYVWNGGETYNDNTRLVDELRNSGSSKLVATSLDDARGVYESSYSVEVSNVNLPSGYIWNANNEKNSEAGSKKIYIYRRPLTPHSFVTMGNGSTRTVVVMYDESNQDTKLMSNDYTLVVGYKDGSGYHDVKTVKQETKGNTRWFTLDESSFAKSDLYVYAQWTYGDGSKVTSGLCYRTAVNATPVYDEAWDGSVFTDTAPSEGTIGTRGDNSDADAIELPELGEENTDVVIYDIHGFRVSTSTKNLAPGMYILKGVQNGKQVTKKFIVR